MLLIGFSRGGTHLVWCFLASHPALVNRRKEVNELASLRAQGVLRKLLLEFASLSGLGWPGANLSAEKFVDKAVCSWPRDRLFAFLRRHDPTKYIGPLGYSYSDKVFLIRHPDSQVASWMKRGCSRRKAQYFYLKHVENWKKIACGPGTASFLRFEDFCKNPVDRTKEIWRSFNLADDFEIKEILWAPKAHSGNSTLPQSHSANRKWVTSDLQSISDMLKNSVVHPPLHLSDEVYAAYETVSTS